jgi:hypothetical protein
LLISSTSFSQLLPKTDYPKDYFKWPLALKPALAANFGELRPNHYHMGLDCKTDKKQNQSVLAAASGYIAKVKIEPSGFGRCIYINHPNGLTTLYAHLNDFYPELEKYVTAQQYKLKSWRIFIDIPADLFPVNQGQFIAFSGNTGGSEGPHMHFEIRNTKTEKVLNPLLFGFPITDDIAPDIQRIALYDRSISTYEQSPQLFPLKKINGIYMTSPALIMTNTGIVSFGITAFDRYTGSTNHNGIYEALLYDNDKPVIGFQLNSISYDETRYLNAHIDYKLRSSGGPFVQHLSRLPGYTNSIYTPINGDGVISIADDSVHRIKIEVKDANGNTSTVQLNIKRNINIPKKAFSTPASPDIQKEFLPGFINVFENSEIGFYLPEKCLYDSFRFQYKKITGPDGKISYQLHNNSVPLQVGFPLKIRSNIPVSLRDKVVMERYWNNKNDFAKATPVTVSNEDWFVASFRDFGYFRLVVDTIPPTITPAGFKDGMNCSKQNRIAFVISDNSEELKNFTATLDGKWLRFSNDKGRTFIYNFDEMCPAGYHELVLSVEDLVGNKTQRIYHFTR